MQGIQAGLTMIGGLQAMSTRLDQAAALARAALTCAREGAPEHAMGLVFDLEEPLREAKLLLETLALLQRLGMRAPGLG